MADFVSGKMKRKGIEEVYDDFAEFSLTSPARKIRRLDADLPPIFEEEESINLRAFDQPLPAVSTDEPLNEERAIVLYKPVNSSVLGSSDMCIEVNPAFVHTYKYQSLWWEHPRALKEADGRQAEDNSKSLAVVPWGLSSMSPYQWSAGYDAPSCGTVEAEVVDGTTMEIEDSNLGVVDGDSELRVANNGVSSVLETERSDDVQQQWQQQHCMAPLLPQNASTPVMWSW